ncbi:cysteine hydrolase family protein [Paenibacillus qinlingensis]|uniref:Nicotinamidase-related amidase n=1 Tax=Paenibacillus qinlingensis TaxID=1837343 RepID=A0ABU1NNL6_9BACL|nr:cysteine hydrolase family protein [Paenibacillus qinlingensis]MDR6549069.1 nicotinamidase-related amidase [Paenibacillus qinlingensis]
MMDKNLAALLVVDVQVGMFNKSDPVHQADLLIENIKSLIDKARSYGTKVIYVQHNARPGKPFERETPGWEIHPAIRPNVGDTIIQKNTPDSFHETNLQEELLVMGVKQIFLTGIQTELCIDSTCRRAQSLGYNVVLVKDAHSTWKRGELDAEQIIEHHNNLLCWFAEVKESSQIQF